MAARNHQANYAPSSAIAGRQAISGAWLKHTPLFAVLTYVTVTYLLFLFSPFQWRIENHAAVFLVSAASMLCFTLGYKIGVDRKGAVGLSLAVKPLVVTGGIVATIVLLPSARIYTGLWPWELLAALEDQTKAYQNIATRLLETEGQRGLVAFIRALAAPIILASSILGVIYWGNLKIRTKVFAAAAISAAIIFSILRGTNREIFDSIILVSCGIAVHLGRKNLGKAIKSKKVFRTIIWAIGIVFLFIFVFNIFLIRVNDRLGDQSALCIGVTGICADFASGLYQFLPYEASRSLGLITGYLSTGYFAVSLALTEDFSSAFGLGHSPALLSIYQQYIGRPEAVFDSYPYLLYTHGWDPSAHWSGMLTWVAADIGFSGAVLLMGAVGYLYGRSWNSAINAGNDVAAILFYLLTLTMFYFPGNFQLALYIDGYFALIFYIFLYLIWRRRV